MLNKLKYNYMIKISTISFLFLLLCSTKIKAQEANIILGRPTNSSITASIMFEENVVFRFMYGTQSETYTDSTDEYFNEPNIPSEIDLQNLLSNTRYYYKVRYHSIGNDSLISTPEYSFYTQRSPGSTFTFTVESDEHLYDKKGVKSIYKICLANQANDSADFMLSLGDIFGDDHTPETTTSEDMNELHRAYRPFLGNICHSVPFFVCLGNHEGENDYYLNRTPPNNIAVYGTLWRKHYYPNPYPNNFYSGDTIHEGYGMGQPENYYAWTWGDALFVVLDVYRDECDTTPKPKNWDWSLGYPQYSWLKTTLEKDRKSTRLNSSHVSESRMPSSA